MKFIGESKQKKLTNNLSLRLDIAGNDRIIWNRRQ